MIFLMKITMSSKLSRILFILGCRSPDTVADEKSDELIVAMDVTPLLLVLPL